MAKDGQGWPRMAKAAFLGHRVWFVKHTGACPRGPCWHSAQTIRVFCWRPDSAEKQVLKQLQTASIYFPFSQFHRFFSEPIFPVQRKQLGKSKAGVVFQCAGQADKHQLLRGILRKIQLIDAGVGLQMGRWKMGESLCPTPNPVVQTSNLSPTSCFLLQTKVS